MTLELIREFLGWSLIINFGFLLYWAGFLLFARKWVYRMHNRFIPMSEEQFNGIHYGGIAYYKVTVLVFNLVPWIVLHIMG